jgi:hypothetical protein
MLTRIRSPHPNSRIPLNNIGSTGLVRHEQDLVPPVVVGSIRVHLVQVRKRHLDECLLGLGVNILPAWASEVALCARPIHCRALGSSGIRLVVNPQGMPRLVAGSVTIKSSRRVCSWTPADCR